MDNNLRIVFMGTPDFAVASLEALLKNNFNVVGVVTAPDKPAGRGKKIKMSAVKECALKNNLNILQPLKFNNRIFIDELQSLKADLFIVVAFRMLPQIIWAMPKYGTFNLHASLLPQYRGAAPINWAIINGEKETGVSSFFLDKNIDTGKIIFSEKINISDDDNVEDLHDKLMILGADTVIKTVKAIIDDNCIMHSQNEFIDNITVLKKAPKIFKEDCRIIWQNSINEIYNFIRGLSPYPAAFTYLLSPENEKFYVKIFKVLKESDDNIIYENNIITDGKTYLKIPVKSGFINILELQLSSKKKMNINDFLRGFNINNKWKIN